VGFATFWPVGGSSDCNVFFPDCDLSINISQVLINPQAMKTLPRLLLLGLTLAILPLMASIFHAPGAKTSKLPVKVAKVRGF
jgi:hypothetical protein